VKKLIRKTPLPGSEVKLGRIHLIMYTYNLKIKQPKMLLGRKSIKIFQMVKFLEMPTIPKKAFVYQAYKKQQS
jgi:hypothetical protein